jgi:hypothetical protein
LRSIAAISAHETRAVAESRWQTQRSGNYRASDAQELNRIAVAAFSQFQDVYEDWPAMRAIVSKASALSDTGEVVIAESDGRLVGGVTYVGPNVAKAPFFDPRGPSFACWWSIPIAAARVSAAR